MNELPVIVIGAGGHAAVVADALLAAGRNVLGFTDADPARRGAGPCGRPVLGGDEVLAAHDPAAVQLANGIGGVGRAGDGARRRDLQRAFEPRGWSFTTVRHPAAVVSPFARIDPGVQLLAGCIVQAGAHVGTGCIVNTAAIVEHDVELGAWSHLAPRALLCGEVRVGSACHVGAGALVRQGLRVGDDTIVGAGAVVIADVPSGSLCAGVPARSLRERA